MASDCEDIFAEGLGVFGQPQIYQGERGGEFEYVRAGVRLRIKLPSESSADLFAHFVWISAIFTADWICDGKIDVKGKRVLELGAGGALPGICAAANGAHWVALTDYPSGDIVTNIGGNVARSLAPEAAARCSIAPHVWGTPLDDVIATLPLDARSNDAFGSFDVVLMADTMWLPEQHAAQMRTVKRALALEGTAYAIFADHTCDGGAFAFVAKARDEGLVPEHVTTVKVPGAWGEEASFDSDDYRIECKRTVHVYVLRHASTS